MTPPTNDFDRLLQKVQAQARQAGIPISPNIDPHIAVNTRARHRFGQCINRGGHYTIELSAQLLTAPEEACCQTIAHELIHTCPGCGNHGPLFRQYAEIMNRRCGYHISRVNTREEMGLPTEGASAPAAKYLLRCQRCGKEFPRSRRSAAVDHPSRYTCPCGGPLELVGQHQKTEPSPADSSPTTAKYLLRCQRCGKEFPRSRRSASVDYPSRYTCPCGGSLKRIR